MGRKAVELFSGARTPTSNIFTILFVVLSSSVVLLVTAVWYKLDEIMRNNDDEMVSLATLSSNPTGLYSNTTLLRGWDDHSPLSIPRGQAVNLPSIRETDKELERRRSFYGGIGDKKHLGGFTDIDIHGISPMVWSYMMTGLGIKSLMDVGCGRGISTLWFHLQGVEILCVEGSHDAIQQSVLPDVQNQVVEHDYSRGPWWPAKTYDAVWSVEFLEHVGVNFHFNYISTFRKAAIIFVTSSRWGGWHHVEVHQDDWWIRKFTSYGFIYDSGLTQKVKNWTDVERVDPSRIAPNGQRYGAQHIGLSMKVFINPAVASLPQHAHLFFEHGCSQARLVNRPCGKVDGRGDDIESVLPTSFLPLQFNQAAEKQWEDVIKKNLKPRNDSEN